MWNSAASNLLLSFPYRGFYFFFLSSPRAYLCVNIIFFYRIYAVYIFIPSGDTSAVMEALITKKDLEIFSQIHITCLDFFVGSFFRCIIIRDWDMRRGGDVHWRNVDFFVFFHHFFVVSRRSVSSQTRIFSTIIMKRSFENL